MSEEGYGAYDPTAPEGASGSSAYVTKRDVRVVLAAVVILLLCAWPIFKMLERRAQRAVCATNMGSIANALSQYADLHDDRFPPIMRAGPQNQPDLGNTGHPWCWASDLVELMTPRTSFRCPAATDKEVTWIEGPRGLVPLTYGMYYPYGAYLRTIINNPDQTMVVSETSNMGSENTFDPVPYAGGWDGFAIGWSSSNDTPGPTSKLISRLAFADTANGQFKKDGPTRHDKGIHALNCEGAMILIPPTAAEVPINRGLPGGLWQSPPVSALVH